MTSSKKIKSFRQIVWAHYKKEGRHDLPWRKTRDPYKVLVSEMMLQQTQVSRVVPKYKEFLKAFPTVRMLAKAPLSNVLKVWSGLGYNRRAKYLHDAAKVIVEEYESNFNLATASLKLPGVGPYTRAAVRIFAFNEPHTMIETNIRTALIHHFFRTKKTTSDAKLLSLLSEANEEQGPREWHWALMDYGAHLKQIGVRNNAKSVHYTKQSKFKGSLREVRGAILRELHASQTERKIFTRLNIVNPGQREKALATLVRDGLIVKKKGRWRIA